MSQIVDLKLPATPPCWNDCGNCATDELVVGEVLVKPGQQVEFGETLLVLETNKVGLEVPSVHDGCIVEVLVKAGDIVSTEDVIARIEIDA